MFKYVSVHPDDVPKDLPFDTKFDIKNISGEGVNMGDPKLGWIKANYYVINLIHKKGTIKIFKFFLFFRFFIKTFITYPEKKYHLFCYFLLQTFVVTYHRTFF